MYGLVLSARRCLIHCLPCQSEVTRMTSGKWDGTSFSCAFLEKKTVTSLISSRFFKQSVSGYIFHRFAFLHFQQASDDDNALPTRPEEPEQSAAEKIYATLRECREQADPKKQKGVKMQGFLLKKKEKVGKWKQQFFLLKQDGQDSHLYFYEHPKASKTWKAKAERHF